MVEASPAVELGAGDSSGRALWIARMVASSDCDRSSRAGCTVSFASIASSAFAAVAARQVAPRLADAPFKECTIRRAVAGSWAVRAARISERAPDCESAKRVSKDPYRLGLPPLRLRAVTVSIPGITKALPVPVGADGPVA